DRVGGGVGRVLLQPDLAPGRDGGVQHQVGLVVDVPRRARAGVVVGARLGPVQPGVARGQVERLVEGAVDVDVQRRVDAAAAGRVRDGEAGDERVRGRLAGELDVRAGAAERHGAAAGRLTGQVADRPVGADA